MAFLTDFFGVGTASGILVDVKENGATLNIGGYRVFFPTACIFEGKIENNLPFNFQLRVLDNNPGSIAGPAVIAGDIGGDKFFDVAATYVVISADTLQVSFNNDGQPARVDIRRTPENPASTTTAWSGVTAAPRTFNMVPK